MSRQLDWVNGNEIVYGAHKPLALSFLFRASTDQTNIPEEKPHDEIPTLTGINVAVYRFGAFDDFERLVASNTSSGTRFSKLPIAGVRIPPL